MKLTELIARAPWREAKTYRNTWPHEYVLSEADSQQELLQAVCERFRAGEGVSCRFFSMNNTYLFIGDHKYWLMTHWDDLEPGEDYVLNRARLYRDRRDFVIQLGDSGKPEDYPVNPRLSQFDHPGRSLRPATPGRLRMPQATIGQHNELILKEFINISDEEIAELVREEVLETS